MNSLINFNIQNENEALQVINQLNEQSIYDILTTNINRKYSPYQQLPMPSLVNMIETTMKVTMMNYPDDAQNIMESKQQLYGHINDIIADAFQLELTIPDDTEDLYSFSAALDDFFVCNFTNYLVMFFSNFIYKEKTNLYNEVGLAEKRKKKDSSIIYGKRMYSNTKLAIITAFIGEVIDAVCGYDIDIYTIFNTVCYPQVAQYISSFVKCKTDFFKDYYVSMLTNPYTRTTIVSSVRLALHNMAVNVSTDNLIK